MDDFTIGILEVSTGTAPKNDNGRQRGGCDGQDVRMLGAREWLWRWCACVCVIM